MMRDGRRCFAQPRRFPGDARAQIDEKLPLDFEDALVGGEDFALVFLQLRTSEALGVDEGLLALVVAGREMQVRFGDLDVVPEDLVEADFERSDIGALPLALFHRGDDLLAVLAEIAQLVEFGVKAAADDAGIGGERGWLVGERAFKEFAHVSKLVDFVVKAAKEFAASCGRRHHKIFEDGKLRQRFAKREQFARRGQAERNAAGQPLEIENAAQFLANFTAHHGLLDKVRDGAEARLHGVAVEERTKNPGAKQARGHAGNGGIERGKQRCRAAARGFFGENRID